VSGLLWILTGMNPRDQCAGIRAGETVERSWSPERERDEGHEFRRGQWLRRAIFAARAVLVPLVAGIVVVNTVNGSRGRDQAVREYVKLLAGGNATTATHSAPHLHTVEVHPGHLTDEMLKSVAPPVRIVEPAGRSRSLLIGLSIPVLLTVSEKIVDPSELKGDLDHHLRVHYNTVRLHKGVGYLTPENECRRHSGGVQALAVRRPAFHPPRCRFVHGGRSALNSGGAADRTATGWRVVKGGRRQSLLPISEQPGGTPGQLRGDPSVA
jgi:hypothetical protein